jgi:putative Flp pilus-assembly TadE/G-like protein
VGTPVIGAFHELRRSEEGQALVLAAVFGLVLMLCVLATVNLGRTVYDKIQLQAAADSAAYSEAALEARVMNFTAFTNRAMVVHYASMMAATSYLTWLHFVWAGLKPLLQVLREVPYIGAIAAAIENGLGALVRAIDAGIAALCPLLSSMNMLLHGLQEGAWHSVWLRLGQPLPPEAHSGDSAARPYRPIWPALLPLANQAVFALTRGHLTMPQNAAESLRILTNAKEDAVQQARLHMIEIANSARQPWVAYGDRYRDPALSPIARHFSWGFSVGVASLRLGSVGRTEMGGYAPHGGSGSAQRAPPQIWSGQRLQLVAKAFGFRKRLNVLSLVEMDQLYAPFPPAEHQYYLLFSVPGWLKPLLPGIGRVREEMSNALRQYAPEPAQRMFWMSPYVSFAPEARGKPTPGPSAPLGNFAQPDVVVGLALDAADADAEGATTYQRRFSWNGRGAGSAAVEMRSRGAVEIPELPRELRLLRRGLNAFAAAQAYYHRPGEWKEMPNFFNPLWGARLMPVLESNVAARLGLTAVPLLQRFLVH